MKNLAISFDGFGFNLRSADNVPASVTQYVPRFATLAQAPRDGLLTEAARDAIAHEIVRRVNEFPGIVNNARHLGAQAETLQDENKRLRAGIASAISELDRRAVESANIGRALHSLRMALIPPMPRD